MSKQSPVERSALDVRGKTILILGLGTYSAGSGVSAALFCARHGARRVIVSDLKSREQLRSTVRQLQGFSQVELHFGPHRLSDVRRADLIVRNPAVANNAPAVRLARQLKKIITNDIGLFLAHKPQGRVVAITGTRGKSTTATLTYQLLRTTYPRTKLGGNIGTSPLQFIDQLQPWDITVLELSSWMLHDLDQPQFDVAVMTNILPDHLNRYPSLAVYQQDKEKIWRWQKKEAFIILNAHDKKVAAMAAKAPSTELWIGASSDREVCQYDLHHACIRQGKITISGEEVALLKDVQLRGEHNRFNVLAAVTIAKIFGVPNAQIVKTLRQFKSVPHRLELVRTVRGVQYYNDTTATIPEAAIAALKSFPKKVILIAGGNFKGVSMAPLARILPQKVKQLILLAGNANAPLKRAMAARTVTARSSVYGANAKKPSTLKEVATMEQAVQQATLLAKKGDIVLLSPGCTWLPQMNEFARGAAFVRAVKKINL